MRRLPAPAVPRFAAAFSLAVAGALAFLAAAGDAFAQPPPEPDAPVVTLPPNARAGRPSDPDRLMALLHGTNGLTAAEVAKRAVATSPDARARDAALAGATERVEVARAGYLPKLTTTARYTRLSPITPPSLGAGSLVVTPTAVSKPTLIDPTATPLFATPLTFPVFLNNYLLQATVTAPLSDYVFRLGQGVAAAAHNQRAAELGERITRLRTAAEARISFYQWIRARGAALVSEQALEQAHGHRLDAQHLFEAGIVSKADTMRAESAVKTVELMILRARNAVALSEEALRVAMHDPSAAPYEIGEDILAPLPPVAAAEPAQLVSEAAGTRLEVKVFEETLGSLGELERIARAAAYPRLDVVGNATYANPNQRIFPQQDKFTATWDASLVLSWTPTDLPGSNASLRETRARRAEAEAQRDALLDGLRLEVTQAWQAVREAEAALATTAQGLAAAEEAYRVRNDLFRNGKATLVELTDAETDLTRARLEAVAAHIDARIARVRLDHATGRDLI